MKREAVRKVSREMGLSILKENRGSNLGWRVILNSDTPSFLSDVISATANGTKRLVEILPSEFCEKILAEVDKYELPGKGSEGLQETPKAIDIDMPSVRVTSFEGAKGLSAQHVFIAGLHNGELPHDEEAITDLEICKFVVGLTRTRKKCTLIHTGHFAGTWKTQSLFISWIDDQRLEHIKVDAAYWKKKKNSDGLNLLIDPHQQKKEKDQISSSFKSKLS